MADAVLRARLAVDVVIAAEALWKPHRVAVTSAEHSHWDWSLKTGRLAIPDTRILGVECDGAIEGMALVFERGHHARLPPATGRPLVYVDFLEAAPWNLRGSVSGPRFKGVGVTLMTAVERLSESLGCEGRVGLHSLDQAENFYARTCQMAALGSDRGYYGLAYFEWTTARARRFVKEPGQ